MGPQRGFYEGRAGRQKTVINYYRSRSDGFHSTLSDASPPSGPYLHLPQGLLRGCVREIERRACEEAIYIRVPRGESVRRVCSCACVCVHASEKDLIVWWSIFYFHPSLADTLGGKRFGCLEDMNDRKERRKREDIWKEERQRGT